MRRVLENLVAVAEGGPLLEHQICATELQLLRGLRLLPSDGQFLGGIQYLAWASLRAVAVRGFLGFGRVGIDADVDGAAWASGTQRVLGLSMSVQVVDRVIVLALHFSFVLLRASLAGAWAGWLLLPQDPVAGLGVRVALADRAAVSMLAFMIILLGVLSGVARMS